MMFQRLLPSVFALACAACTSASDEAGGAPPPAASAPPEPSTTPPVPLAWGACDTTEWPDGFALPAAGVTCTTVTVPLDHEHADDGRTLALRVARQRAKSPSTKAVFQLAGGPGGTSVGQSGTIPRTMAKLLDGFDLVYVDQRGTGGSTYLGCSAGYPETKEEWIACAAEHRAEDLGHMLTVDAAHDLEDVRKALGYEKIDVRGGSYGTRVGLELLRQHGASVEAMVLDGADPPDGTFFQDFIRAADRGVARLVADCSKSAPCQAITKDLRADLDAHRTALRAKPRAILLDGKPATEDEATFLEILGAALFESSTYFRLPRAIHGAATGDFAAWDALYGDLSGRTVSEPGHTDPAVAPPVRRVRALRTRGLSYVAPALYMTVVCSEDLPNAGGLDALRALQAAQAWGGDPGVLEIAEACSAWRVSAIASSLRAPVRSDARVLLLNGDLDLNTYPEWGAHAAETLPHATNLLVPYATHSTMSIPCVGKVITDYFGAGGEMSKVDASCIAKLPEPAW